MPKFSYFSMIYVWISWQINILLFLLLGLLLKYWRWEIRDSVFSVQTLGDLSPLSHRDRRQWSPHFKITRFPRCRLMWDDFGINYDVNVPAHVEWNIACYSLDGCVVMERPQNTRRLNTTSNHTNTRTRTHTNWVLHFNFFRDLQH